MNIIINQSKDSRRFANEGSKANKYLRSQPYANIHNIIMNNSKTQLIETMDYSNNKHN